MNPIKKFYNFFRSVKDTNSAMSENKVTEKGWNIKKKSERADSKNPTETEKQQQNEVTAKCLKEFDNILQEINRDVLKEPVTLDEIEDVLNNITEEHNLKESEFLNLEIPRFDLQDLLQGFDSFNENHIEEVDENNLEKIHEPIDLDESNEIKLYYLDKNNKPTEITDFFIKIREDDVISINSDDSQAHEVNIEENYEPKNVNDVNKRINDEPKNVTKIECINDEPRNVIENEGINAIESKNVTEHGRTNDEPRNAQDANNGINEIKNVKDEEITSKSQDVFEDDSDDDCGYQSSDFEFITEDEAKLDGLIINFHPNMLSVSQPKRVNTFEVAIDQFSEQRNIPSRNSIRPRLNNVQKNSPELKSLGPGPSNMQGNYTEINNLHSGPKVNNIGSSLRYVRKIRPGLNKFDSDPTNLQIYSPGGSGPSCIRLHSQNSTTCGPDNKQRGDPDHSTMKAIIVDDRNGTRPKIKISYHELNNMQHGPESNNLDCSSNLREGETVGPGPSNLQENVPGPSNLRRNCSEMYNPNLERWRTFHPGNQSIRQHFSLDYSYRENHRMLEGEQYYQLFEYNSAHFPYQSSRLLENKSIMPMSNMLLEYEGVGFDMQMLRESESEGDEVKVEAEECARKILDMYPGENRKKRRRF